MRSLLLTTTLVLVVISVIVSANDGDSSSLTKVGDPVPVFSAVRTDGVKISSAELNGKVTVINFFATWCGPCREELPALQREIWEKHRDNDAFELIVVGREHNADEVKAFQKETGFTMPFAPDPERAIYGRFATQYIPRTYVIDADGTIAFQSVGYTPQEFKELTAVVEKLLDRNGKSSAEAPRKRTD